MENYNISRALSLPLFDKDYLELHPTNKRKRAKRFVDVLRLFRISEEDALAILCKNVLSRAEQGNDQLELGIELKKLLSAYNVSLPLSQKDAAALTLHQGFSDNEIRFIRRYIGGLPTIESIRTERWKYLDSMPPVYGLDGETCCWHILGRGRFTLTSKSARNVDCVRLKLNEAIQARLLEFSSIGSWPTPPRLENILESERSSTIVVLLSLDSGTGTVKLMMKIIQECPNQRVSDVTLIAESRGTSEAFVDLKVSFGPIREEISALKTNGLVFQGKKIDIRLYFVGDFKVIYSLTGSFGPSSKYPCPWCLVPSSLMNRTHEELKDIANNGSVVILDNTKLKGRPEIHNLEGKKGISNLQKGNTYNLFCLDRGGGHFDFGTNIVPPLLHIHIGIVNKVVKALDSIVSIWNTKKHYDSENELESPASKLLAMALSRSGARRENYYTGQLSGKPCSNLMSNMNIFCAFFFHRSAFGWGKVTDAVKSSRGLETSLKRLSSLYTGKGRLSGRGVDFFLRYQEKWSAAMISEWDALSYEFVQTLRKAIGRERGRNSGLLSEKQRWLQPLEMPKLHTLTTHCIQFIYHHGYLGAFSEEAFEHFQQVSLRSRLDRTHNKGLGSQICEDLQYSWISGSVTLRQACAEAEDNRASSTRSIRKRKFDLISVLETSSENSIN